jgi:hypothetical protein
MLAVKKLDEAPAGVGAGIGDHGRQAVDSSPDQRAVFTVRGVFELTYHNVLNDTSIRD